jgi:hypothetical protein
LSIVIEPFEGEDFGDVGEMYEPIDGIECGQRNRDIALLVAAGEIMQCRVCGCTDLQACPGGCIWAAPGLCSRCVE